MAIKKAFTDAFGSTHPDGYHRLMRCPLNIYDRNPQFVPTTEGQFMSFHDKAAFDAGKPPISGHVYVAKEITNLHADSWAELILFIETVCLTYDPFFQGGEIIDSGI
jgi:hypothetical protein